MIHRFTTPKGRTAIGLGALALAGQIAAASAEPMPTPDRLLPRDGAGDALSYAIQMENTTMQHPYIGMWVTADGRIRQELLPNGRYDEARGSRRSAYQGRYEVEGNRIDYWDDTGFTADGVFVSPDELHHGGMIFLREK